MNPSTDAIAASIAAYDPQSTKQRWRSEYGERVHLCPPDQSFRPPQIASRSELGASGFRLEECIGRGGMGEVFRARQIELERDVAYKRLRPDVARASETRTAFLAEAIVAGRLDHPNIVPVYALGEQDGNPFMAMKLVAGQTWHTLLHREEPPELEAQLDILLQVCNAVAFAHSRSIVHNDLKPSNVMIGAFGEVTVLDWGLAVDFRENADPTSRVRHKSSIDRPCGTPSYMAPELALGLGDCIGPWTDIYVLGAILFEILSGHPPHGSDSVDGALECVATGATGELPASIPEPLRDLCLRALARFPHRRQASVSEFQAQLVEFRRNAESHALTGQAQTALQVCRQKADEAALLEESRRQSLYQTMAETASRFRQARALWPANAAALAGECQARHIYAETALRNGDLGVAIAQTREIAALGEPSALLEEQILSARKLRQQLQTSSRRLRWGLRLTVSLVIFCLVGLSVVLMLWKDNAEEQRDRSDRLVGSMLLELYEPLRQVERLDLLEHVAESVRSYYAEIPISGARGDELLHRGTVHRSIADVYALRAQPDGALDRYREALAPLQLLLARDASDPLAHRELASVFTHIGFLHETYGQVDSALEAFTRAIDYLETARALGDPSTDTFLQHQHLGNLLLAQDEAEAALLALERGYASFLDAPNNVQAERLLSSQIYTYLYKMGTIYQSLGRFSRAEAVLREGLAACEQVYAHQPTAATGSSIGEGHDLLAELFLIQIDPIAAQEALHVGLQAKLELLAEHQEQPSLLRGVFRSYGLIGNAHELAGEHHEALQVYRKSLEITGQLVEYDANQAQWQRDRSVAWDDLARVHRRLDQPGLALEASLQALEISERLHARHPDNTTGAYALDWSRFLWVGFSAALVQDTALATDTLRRGVRKLPGHFHLALWHWAFSGETEPLAALDDLEPWQRVLTDYALGVVELSELVATVRSEDQAAQSYPLCVVHSFLGLLADRQGDGQTAREHYRLCLQTDQESLYSLWAAKRLAKLEED